MKGKWKTKERKGRVQTNKNEKTRLYFTARKKRGKAITEEEKGGDEKKNNDFKKEKGGETDRDGKEIQEAI